MDVPVKLGTLDPSDTLGEALHKAAADGNAKALKKALMDGINVDYPNDAGQTPLFIACCGGHTNATKVLMEQGANPNEKSNSGVTPLHIASFVGDLTLFGRLIEAGGDLRLHDDRGQNAKDWALMQTDSRKRVKMLEYIDKIHLFAMTGSGREISRRAYDGIAGRKTSLIQMIKEKLGSSSAMDIYRNDSLGFGRVYTCGTTAGIISVIPLISENSLRTDEQGVSYKNGTLYLMESCRWRDNAVTLKKLMNTSPQLGSCNDLLLQELEMMGRVRHPNILLLMGLCQTTSLDQIMLIYERIGIGSLYSYLHEQMLDVPIKLAAEMLLQICDAMVYLHDQNLIHCSITSHAIHLVNATTVKLGNLEFAVESEKADLGKQSSAPKVKEVNVLYNWMAPEVMSAQVPTFGSDVYSFCCVIWEIVHSRVPWHGLKADAIKGKVVDEGASLPVDSAAFPAHLEEILVQGLVLEPKQRSKSFRQIATKLRSTVTKDDFDSQRHRHGPQQRTVHHSKDHNYNRFEGNSAKNVSKPESSHSHAQRYDQDPCSNNNHPGHTQELDEEVTDSEICEQTRQKKHVYVHRSAGGDVSCSSGEDMVTDVWRSSYRLNRNVEYSMRCKMDNETCTYNVQSHAISPTEDPRVVILSPRKEDIRYYDKNHKSKSTQASPKSSRSRVLGQQRQAGRAVVPPSWFSYLGLPEPKAGLESIKPASHLMEVRHPNHQLSTAGTLFSLYNEVGLQTPESLQPSAPPEFEPPRPDTPSTSPDREGSNSCLFLRQGSVKNLVTLFEQQVHLHESSQAVLEGRRSPPCLEETEYAAPWQRCPDTGPVFHSNPTPEIELPAYEHTFLYPRLSVPGDCHLSSGSAGSRLSSQKSLQASSDPERASLGDRISESDMEKPTISKRKKRKIRCLPRRKLSQGNRGRPSILKTSKSKTGKAASNEKAGGLPGRPYAKSVIEIRTSTVEPGRHELTHTTTNLQSGRSVTHCKKTVFANRIKTVFDTSR